MVGYEFEGVGEGGNDFVFVLWSSGVDDCIIVSVLDCHAPIGRI
jgi:hypothetical protein